VRDSAEGTVRLIEIPPSSPWHALLPPEQTVHIRWDEDAAENQEAFA
jgi:hypothetical protein